MPVDPEVTARTDAPGRGPPRGAMAASGGRADQSRTVSSRDAPIRIAGWMTPCCRSEGSRTPIAQLDRQYVLERCAAQPAPGKRTAAGDNQSTTSNGHEV